jgi:fructose-1,6-bisphosphatase/inositol monophosphatase family enzyme
VSAAEAASRLDPSFADELSFATALAIRAGELLMDRYERVERVDYKSARDVVTEVDHLSEELIIDAIRARYPGDGILAEESGEHVAVAGSSPTSGQGRVWVVDPVDGTINYANGIPYFCVSIGLAVDGRPAVGVIHDPSRHETFAATSGGPATLEGRVIGASEKDKLTDYVVHLALGGRRLATRMKQTRKQIRVGRTMGSAALALAYVGASRFDAFVQEGGLSNWDIAAAGLIAERGGATVTAMDGGPWFDIGRGTRSIGLIAAPPAHHGTLLDLVR